MRKFYAKFTTFGWLYGRQAPSIQEQYGVPLAEAQEIVNTLDRLYPRIVMWKAEVATEALRRGELRNPFGRRRFFAEGSDGDKEREAYAFIPQSTLHDVVQRAHILVEEHYPESICQVVADHHDALICVVEPSEFDPKGLVGLVSREYLPGLTMPFDISIGEWWIDKRAEEDALGKLAVSERSA